MFFIRKRKMNVSSAVALVAALVLIATEVFAGSDGVAHLADSVIIVN